MPLATAKDVITQVPWSVEAPRLPAMVGSETLALVLSSTCMKVPSASASAVIASGAPVMGFSSAPGALMLRSPVAGLGRARPVLGQDAGDQRVGGRGGVFTQIAAGHAGADPRGHHRAGRVADIDRDIDRETHAQRMIAQLLGIEGDA